jgi:hypothetical protein
VSEVGLESLTCLSQDRKTTLYSLLICPAQGVTNSVQGREGDDVVCEGKWENRSFSDGRYKQGNISRVYSPKKKAQSQKYAVY